MLKSPHATSVAEGADKAIPQGEMNVRNESIHGPPLATPNQQNEHLRAHKGDDAGTIDNAGNGKMDSAD